MSQEETPNNIYLQSSNMGHAVVLGSGIAGLAVARVLCKYFDQVTLVERDKPQDKCTARPGVSQSRSIHLLLSQGQVILSKLFPDILDTLKQDGAEQIDLGKDLLWYQDGNYFTQFNSGVIALSMSRALLEYHIRQRVLSLPNIRYLPNHYALKLITHPESNITKGVVIRSSLNSEQRTRNMLADVVVDAMGSSSPSRRWISSLGLPAPKSSIIRINFSYTSCIFQKDTNLLPEFKGILTGPYYPIGTRGGTLFPLEKDRWFVSLAGWLNDHCPTSEQEFFEFAKSLPTQDIYNVIKSSRRISDFFIHRFAADVWHHYESLDCMPQGYIIIGDSLCRINPFHGQGMSLSLMEVAVLEQVIKQYSKSKPQPSFSSDYFKKVAGVIADPWMVTANVDQRFSNLGKHQLPVDRVLTWYISQVQQLSHNDPQIALECLRIMSLMVSPYRLGDPRIVLRVFKRFFSSMFLSSV